MPRLHPLSSTYLNGYVDDRVLSPSRTTANTYKTTCCMDRGTNRIGFLNEEKTKELLASPDTNTSKGLRDQALLCLLYDSGARVQELADIRIRDLHMDSPAQVKLTGKGRKTRSVPLMNQTVGILKEYLKKNGLDKVQNADNPLFYNAQGKKLYIIYLMTSSS